MDKCTWDTIPSSLLREIRGKFTQQSGGGCGVKQNFFAIMTDELLKLVGINWLSGHTYSDDYSRIKKKKVVIVNCHHCRTLN